jgi:hypothetical protein
MNMGLIEMGMVGRVRSKGTFKMNLYNGIINNMKNKISFMLTLVIFLGVLSVRTFASTEDINEPSVSREMVEQAEEKVLSAEAHATLEEVEPNIDALINRFFPITLGGISVLMLALVLYTKFKKQS